MNAERGADPAALVARFRPVYRLHSEEMWYPCHPEDQLRCADLVSTEDGSIVIPALGEGTGSSADQLLCTPQGLQELAGRGVSLDQQTVEALRWAPTSSPHYGALTPTSAFVLRRADSRFMPPYGWIESANYKPQQGTWFHHQAPNNPLTWLGGDASTYAEAILSPPAGTLRGAWQEPTTGAWVQCHTVAGVEYVDVIYTAMLGWNGSISLLAGEGEHPNDVETVVVRLAASDLEHPVRYMFQQHGGFAWYEPPEVELEGERLVVYLARQSHECYPHPGRATRLFGIADDICDSGGVSWDAPVEYMDRPQGIDSQGVDTDALRASVLPGDPAAVVLVPLGEPGPLWQYLRFRFLSRRPEGTPLDDDDFLFQPFPLATTKWWPPEGPAGTSPPLSEKAAEPSAPGVPPAFFDDVAPYLGPDPSPGQSEGPAQRERPEPAAAAKRSTAEPAVAETVIGSEIGGATRALAPDAPFVDWRGSIGTHLLSSIDSHMAGWVAELPDPLEMTDVVLGELTIERLAVSGFRTLAVAPVVPSAATTLRLYGSAPQISAAGTISFQSLHNVPLTAKISSVTVDASAQMITPVARPVSGPAQWYIPYVGPLPYSYATKPFETTAAICDATMATLALTYEAIEVDVGSSWEDAIIDALLVLFKQTIENDLSNVLRETVNDQLSEVFGGTRRVG